MHKDDEIIYNGQLVKKHEFRAFIYGFDNQKKLMNHYDDYEAHISSGIWFPSLKDVPIPTKIQKTNKKKEAHVPEKTALESDEIDELVNKLEDDFLPKQ